MNYLLLSLTYLKFSSDHKQMTPDILNILAVCNLSSCMSRGWCWMKIRSENALPNSVFLRRPWHYATVHFSGSLNTSVRRMSSSRCRSRFHWQIIRLSNFIQKFEFMFLLFCPYHLQINLHILNPAWYGLICVPRREAQKAMVC